MALVAVRSERVGMGAHTFDLVNGQPIPADLPEEAVQSLLDNNMIKDDGVPEPPDTYSQEYRDAQAEPAPAPEPEEV